MFLCMNCISVENRAIIKSTPINCNFKIRVLGFPTMNDMGRCSVPIPNDCANLRFRAPLIISQAKYCVKFFTISRQKLERNTCTCFVVEVRGLAGQKRFGIVTNKFDLNASCSLRLSTVCTRCCDGHVHYNQRQADLSNDKLQLSMYAYDDVTKVSWGG